MNNYLGLYLLFASLAPSLGRYTLSIHQYPSVNGSLPGNMKIGEGESLFLFWRPTQQPLTACNISTPAEKIDLLTDTNPNFIKSPIMTFNDGYCCVKVKTIESKHQGTWQMWARVGDLSFHTETNLTVAAPVVYVNQSLTVRDTSFTFTVNCGSPQAIYCRLKSPKGKLWTYLGPCQHTVFDISTSEEGIWACSFAVQDYVREFKGFTQVTIVEDDTKELFLKEFPNEYAFYCMTPKNLTYAMMCRITTPYGMNLYLTPGKAYGRYTYYGEKPNHCGVTIPKPLSPQDVGPWKCQLMETTNPRALISYGGYMTIGKEKNLKKIEVPSKKLFWTPNDDNKYLLCHVPYIIKYCWFKSPNGTVYNIKDGNRLESNTILKTQGFKFGDCAKSFERNEAVNATGKWTCNIGLAKESVSEIMETVEVIYADIPIISLQPTISAELGSAVDLSCVTGEGRAINLCRLVRPDGIGLSVDPTKNNSEYSYSGKGFVHGECGITIQNLKSHDIGNWQCIVTLLNDMNNIEYSTKIQLKQEKGSLLAVYIVVGVAGLFALMGVSYFVVKKFELKINRRVESARLIETDSQIEVEEETSSRSRLDTVNNLVRFVRRRSPRPPACTEPPVYM